MKKLMIALAAATTAMFSFGDFTSTGFEDGASSPYKAGELLSTTNDDNGLVAGNPGFAATWVVLPEGDDSESKILAYGTEGAEAAPTGFGDVGSQYLHVESSSNMLQRNVQTGGVAVAIGDGIYLDTLVKFSPADKLFEASDITTGDKIAITYVGENATEVENPISNIVVYAGYVDGSSIVPTNYVMNLPDNADFDVNAWHRLTVRSIANVGSSVAPVGFAIYIDGNKEPLTYASDVAAGDSAYVGALNAAVQTYLYTGTKHALLPSLVDSTYNGYNELTTVGFKGSGCVDNLAFTAKPGFIEEGTAVEIAWDEGVATYTVVDSENNTLVDGAVTGGIAGSTNLLLDVDITYLTVTATYGTGYEAGTWTVTGDGAAISGGTFTVSDGATLTIASMTPKFDVGGVRYGTFAEALAAAVEAGTSAEPATIQLLADVTEAMTFAEGYIVLDLNGKTIACGSGSRYVLANTGAVLKIIDTATGGIVAAGSNGSILIRGDAAFTTIEAGKYDGTIAMTGQSEVERTDILVVNGGTFYDVDYVDDPENDFYLKGNVPNGVSISEPDNGYFTVGGGEPAELTLTITDNANAESSVTINDEPAETGAVIKADDVIVITATAKSGYEYAQAPEGWTLSEGSITKTITVVDASVSVTIPAPAEVVTTFALTTTGGANAEITTNPANVSALTEATDVTITATATNGFTYATVDLSGTDWLYNSNDDAISMTTNISENTTVVVPDAVSEQSQEDWPEGEDLIDAEGKAASDLFPGITNALATADAKAVATWAAANNVGYADKGSILPEAFLLNCANTQAAIDEAAANFKVTAITIVGDTVTITPADGVDYGNGKVVIEGTATLNPISWHEKTDGDRFFRATLVVKPVAAP